jgi:hypothetical protein
VSTRRTILRRLTLVGGVATAGCAGFIDDDPETQGSGTTTETPLSSETPPATDRPTERSTQPPTKTCAEQFVFPDLRLVNERSTTATVSVRVAAESSGSEPLLAREFVLAAGEERVERERIYRDASPDSEEYRLTATVDGTTESVEVTIAARRPSLRGTRIELHGEGPRLIPVHGDPGERFNPNCYDSG